MKEMALFQACQAGYRFFVAKWKSERTGELYILLHPTKPVTSTADYYDCVDQQGKVHQVWGLARVMPVSGDKWIIEKRNEEPNDGGQK